MAPLFDNDDFYVEPDIVKPQGNQDKQDDAAECAPPEGQDESDFDHLPYPY